MEWTKLPTARGFESGILPSETRYSNNPPHHRASMYYTSTSDTSCINTAATDPTYITAHETRLLTCRRRVDDRPISGPGSDSEAAMHAGIPRLQPRLRPWLAVYTGERSRHRRARPVTAQRVQRRGASVTDTHVIVEAIYRIGRQRLRGAVADKRVVKRRYVRRLCDC